MSAQDDIKKHFNLLEAPELFPVICQRSSATSGFRVGRPDIQLAFTVAASKRNNPDTLCVRFYPGVTGFEQYTLAECLAILDRAKRDYVSEGIGTQLKDWTHAVWPMCTGSEVHDRLTMRFVDLEATLQQLMQSDAVHTGPTHPERALLRILRDGVVVKGWAELLHANAATTWVWESEDRKVSVNNDTVGMCLHRGWLSVDNGKLRPDTPEGLDGRERIMGNWWEKCSLAITPEGRRVLGLYDDESSAEEN